MRSWPDRIRHRAYITTSTHATSAPSRSAGCPGASAPRSRHVARQRAACRGRPVARAATRRLGRWRASAGSPHDPGAALRSSTERDTSCTTKAVEARGLISDFLRESLSEILIDRRSQTGPPRRHQPLRAPASASPGWPRSQCSSATAAEAAAEVPYVLSAVRSRRRTSRGAHGEQADPTSLPAQNDGHLGREVSHDPDPQTSIYYTNPTRPAVPSASGACAVAPYTLPTGRSGCC
jgi:hypothetical protein